MVAINISKRFIPSLNTDSENLALGQNENCWGSIRKRMKMTKIN